MDLFISSFSIFNQPRRPISEQNDVPDAGRKRKRESGESKNAFAQMMESKTHKKKTYISLSNVTIEQLAQDWYLFDLQNPSNLVASTENSSKIR